MNIGAFGENFPYVNFHDLNLDWIIKIFREMKDKLDEGYVVSINGEQGEVEIPSDWITDLGINSVYHTTDNVQSYTDEQLTALYENGYRVVLQENNFGTNDLIYFLTNSDDTTHIYQYTPFSETSGVTSVNGQSGALSFGANNIPWNSSDLNGETIEEKVLGTNDIALWIGDSYVEAVSLGADQQYRFSTRVTNALHCTEKNYAIGGSGYLAPSESTFEDQLTSAISEMTALEKSNTKYVFIAGGRNDPWLVPDYTIQQLNTAVNNCLVLAKNNFPYAKIILIPMLWDSIALTSTYKGYLFDIMRCATFTGNTVRTISNAYTYLTGRHDLILSDNVHPSSAGHAVIANRVLSSLTGENWNTPAFYSTTSNGLTLNFSKIENVIQIIINGTPTEDVAFGTELFNNADFGNGNQFAVCTNGPAFITLTGRDGTTCPAQIFFNRASGKTLFKIQSLGTMTQQSYTGTVHITNGV